MEGGGSVPEPRPVSASRAGFMVVRKVVSGQDRMLYLKLMWSHCGSWYLCIVCLFVCVCVSVCLCVFV